MCEKCRELDDKIEHYRRIAGSISDQLTIDRIRLLVSEMQERKVALHSQEQK